MREGGGWHKKRKNYHICAVRKENPIQYRWKSQVPKSERKYFLLLSFDLSDGNLDTCWKFKRNFPRIYFSPLPQLSSFHKSFSIYSQYSSLSLCEWFLFRLLRAISFWNLFFSEANTKKNIPQKRVSLCVCFVETF